MEWIGREVVAPAENVEAGFKRVLDAIADWTDGFADVRD
jgi:hypothetical protein